VLGPGVILVVLGGTRSGKSEVAERIAAELDGPVTYVAAAVAGEDPDLAARIAAHRARRPASWTTVEGPADLPALLSALDGTVLVESTGSWIAAQPDLDADVDGLCRAATTRRGDTVFVGEEVGLSVHPPTEVGRRFVDAVGVCNRRLADVADRVLLVVAGRSIELGP
jgi:adenosyl cobinamide kinase/adenosyl cobinamide phosphate guanylyltransferase